MHFHERVADQSVGLDEASADKQIEPPLSIGGGLSAMNSFSLAKPIEDIDKDSNGPSSAGGKMGGAAMQQMIAKSIQSRMNQQMQDMMTTMLTTIQQQQEVQMQTFMHTMTMKLQRMETSANGQDEPQRAVEAPVSSSRPASSEMLASKDSDDEQIKEGTRSAPFESDRSQIST